MFTQAAAPRFHLPCLPSPSISDHKFSPVNSSPNRRSQRFDSGRSRKSSFKLCRARRRMRYEEDHNGEEDDEGESYGHNAEIAMLESYTDSTPSVVLLIRAPVEGQEEEVLVYKPPPYMMLEFGCMVLHFVKIGSYDHISADHSELKGDGRDF